VTPDELRDHLAPELGSHVVESGVAFGDVTLTLDADGYVAAAELCRDSDDVACDLFDCLFGVDERDEGFGVVTILYSTRHRHRVILRTVASGGRDRPMAPTLTHLYPGANWHEREAWDMFGIEFEGHPGLTPRILCAENFEGWPLRKDFYLGSRAAKPWPGVKEPAETDDDGNVIVREPKLGDAPGPYILDELMAKQAKQINRPDEELATPGEPSVGVEAADPEPATDEDKADQAKAKAERARKKAAEMRKKKAAERAAAEAEKGNQGSDEPEAES
jgi:NADH-quinone oxidoreductase subunit C